MSMKPILGEAFQSACLKSHASRGFLAHAKMRFARYTDDAMGRLLYYCGVLAVMLASVCRADEAGGFGAALTSGKFDLFARYRFEFADDAGPVRATDPGSPPLKNAYASTLRTALGYATGEYAGFSAYVQAEDVRVIGNDLYNDGGANHVSDRAAVVDPEGTEFNQAYLRFGRIPRTVVTLGRQEITHRNAPLHRYIGNVLFRQNFQSFDALRATLLPYPSMTLDYAYVWQVNRIFGERHPNVDVEDFRSRSHLLNLQYGALEAVKLEGYAYLLDFKGGSPRRFSTATVGARVTGDRVMTGKLKLLYAGEFATQQDYADNQADISARYLNGEVGLGVGVGGVVESMAVKLSYEWLQGKGGVNAFQTPLGTNHAFQGAADRFVVTPGDGIRDAFLTVTAKALGCDWALSFHRFDSDHDRYRYGDEWNFLLQKPLAKGFLIGFEHAQYRADGNALNVQRNSGTGQAFDLVRSWLYVQYRYP